MRGPKIVEGTDARRTRPLRERDRAKEREREQDEKQVVIGVVGSVIYEFIAEPRAQTTRGPITRPKTGASRPRFRTVRIV